MLGVIHIVISIITICTIFTRSPDGNRRSARVAGVDLLVVNLTITDGRRIDMSFYVTLFRKILSADSLETLLSEPSTLNATLSLTGVTVIQVFRPNNVQSSGQESENSVVAILGALLGAAGGVIAIGAFACIIIAG